MSATTATRDLIARRHPEWLEFQLTWRWLMDSYEGGERYRNAVYGVDWRGLPVRNLIRHKREYPDPREYQVLIGGAVYPAGLAIGAANPSLQVQGNVDSQKYANDSDYELRRARTPVPTFVREAVEEHLGKVFSKEVAREGPAQIEEWWEDVDGKGTPIADWIENDVGPLLMVLGQLDILIDHPPAPKGVAVSSRAVQYEHGLNRVVASYILPENLLWWRLDPAGRYQEALVQEHVDEPTEQEKTRAGTAPQSGGTNVVARFRHWTAAGWTLYDNAGEVIATAEHTYGQVPIRRVFDRRNARLRNIGSSRYMSIAERQREYYNRDSELILSDTVQAHPLLQGPEDFVKEDATIPVGPGYLLPMKKNGTGDGASYQGFAVVEFPKGSAESLRLNKEDIRDDVDRDARLTKPAGVARTGRTTVAQSGVSKELDHDSGHKLLTKIVKSLGRLETTLAELALCVALDRPITAAEAQSIEIVYPTAFGLCSAQELSQGLTDFQALVTQAGECPEAEALWLKELLKENLKGQDQATYDALFKEIDTVVEAKAKLVEQRAESMVMTPGAQRQTPGDVAPAGSGTTGAEEHAEAAPEYSAYPASYGGY